MKIDKAISHLKWKFQNSWKPTEKDIEAYNSIVEFKETQEKQNFNQHQTLAKYWIALFINMGMTGSYKSERILQILREIAEKDTHDCCLVLQESLHSIALNRVGSDKHPLEDEHLMNQDKHKERLNKILDEYPKELNAALIKKTPLDHIIKLLETEINHITTLEKTEV